MFSQSHYDSSLLIQRIGSSIILAAVYVDDIILTGDNPTVIDDLKRHLHVVFTIKDLGFLKFFLGNETNYLLDCITMSQHKFTQELLGDCGFSSFKHVVTLLPINLKLQRANSPPIFFFFWETPLLLLTPNFIVPLLANSIFSPILIPILLSLFSPFANICKPPLMLIFKLSYTHSTMFIPLQAKVFFFVLLIISLFRLF